MLCCRRRRVTEAAVLVVAEDIPCIVATDIDAEIAGWYAESNRLDPCPICFEEPADETDVVCYSEVSTHSWANHDRCDGHGICRSCLQRYVEVQLLDQGAFDIRCPGERCHYHLVKDDIENALSQSDEKTRASQIYKLLREENGSIRLQDAISSALQHSDTAENDDADAWLWSECQACPRCFVLAHRADGCEHLACRCGCHFCFRCGGAYPDQDGWNGVSSCICDEYSIYEGSRAYLSAWMCLKHESHAALGKHHAAVREYHYKHVPLLVAREREDEAQKRREAAAKRERRERLEQERAREQEEAAEAWAREQVRGTAAVLHVRRTYESFASALWRAGVDVSCSAQCGTADMHRCASFEGLLVSSTVQARAEDYEVLSSNDDDFTTEGQYDDVLGYIDDYSAAKTQRRAAHGAPRRLCTQTAWFGGEKLKAKATARARQQKHSLVAVERHKIADAQRIRRKTRAQRMRLD